MGKKSKPGVVVSSQHSEAEARGDGYFFAASLY